MKEFVQILEDCAEFDSNKVNSPLKISYSVNRWWDKDEI